MSELIGLLLAAALLLDWLQLFVFWNGAEDVEDIDADDEDEVEEADDEVLDDADDVDDGDSLDEVDGEDPWGESSSLASRSVRTIFLSWSSIIS